MNALCFAATLPSVDPIPLPAPVWLLRLLLDLTLVLHFAALYLFLGGLLVAIGLNWLGHRSHDVARIEASGSVAGWLTILMTYVINLGIPPLLFAQVLYGRALYTSSVLLGAYWIAVIPLLIFCYHLLYLMKYRAAANQSFLIPAFGSFVSAWAIARIYSANMSLMLEPSVWQEAYRATQSGITFLSGAGAWFRWGYMMSMGVVGGGVLVAWLARSQSLSTTAAEIFRSVRTKLILAGSILAILFGGLAWVSQTSEVQTACSSGSVIWLVSCTIWFLGLVGCVVASLRLGDGSSLWTTIALSTAAFLQTAGFVVCRDLIRDAALARVGFDVWDRTVSVNWSVLGLFLILFVAGLGVIGWLATIAYQISPKPETRQ